MTAPVLASHQASWASWSDETGLLENAAKTEATGTSARLQQDLGTCFQPREIKKHVKLLGACTYCNPRSHTEAEELRLSSAKERLRLLGCAGFGLDGFLREAKSFAMSKANFGWIARAPTLTASKQLWSCLWRAAARVHYSSPWVRALIWINCHLDVLWATRLVGGLLRRAARETAQWTLHRGTACCALHEWLVQRGWVLVGEWRWRHALANETLNLVVPLRPRITKAALDRRISKEQHALRAGWRA